MNDSLATKAELATASAVIDALGGTAAVMRLVDGRTMGRVSNWRATGRLAPETFLILSAALAERGLSAPSALWGLIRTSCQREN